MRNRSRAALTLLEGLEVMAAPLWLPAESCEGGVAGITSAATVPAVTVRAEEGFERVSANVTACGGWVEGFALIGCPITGTLRRNGFRNAFGDCNDEDDDDAAGTTAGMG